MKIFFKTFVLFILLNLLAQKNFAQNALRPVATLTTDTSGWDIVKQTVNTAKNKAELLPVDNAKAPESLYQTQVTTRSVMGAVIYFTGGILIDNGWIRLLGSGNKKLPRSLPGWNKGKTFKEYGERPAYLLIGDDAIGGFFAVNGGALGTEMGKVYYLAPETLKWKSLGKGYSEFVDFCLNGNLDEFYKGYRWNGWQKDITQLKGDQVYNFYPYLWSKEGQDVGKTSRKIVPVQEQYDFNMETIKQIKP